MTRTFFEQVGLNLITKKFSIHWSWLARWKEPEVKILYPRNRICPALAAIVIATVHPRRIFRIFRI